MFRLSNSTLGVSAALPLSPAQVPVARRTVRAAPEGALRDTVETRPSKTDDLRLLFDNGAYESRTAAEKSRLLLSALRESEYTELPRWSGLEPLGLIPRALDVFKRFTQRGHMSVTMDRHRDVMPRGRNKPIHTYGSVAPVRFVPNGSHPYTGIYRTGASHGFVRLSLAKKPTADSTTPGMAVKLLVDGRPSLNYQAMHGLEGQTGYNFFRHDFSNFIDPPEGGALKLMQGLFEAARSSEFGPDIDALKVGVEHLGQVDQWGHAVSAPNAPLQLLHRPSAALRSRFSDSPHEVRKDFAEIPQGTTLYDVYAVAEADGLLKIGYLETTGPFVASGFGDASLFFNHQRVLKKS